MNPKTRGLLSSRISVYQRVLISKTWRLLITTFSTKCITSRKRLQKLTKREIRIILAHSRNSNFKLTRLIRFLVTKPSWRRKWSMTPWTRLFWSIIRKTSNWGSKRKHITKIFSLRNRKKRRSSSIKKIESWQSKKQEMTKKRVSKRNFPN